MNNTFIFNNSMSETYILDEFKHEQNRITREIDVLKTVKGENLIKYQEDFYFKNEFGGIYFISL